MASKSTKRNAKRTTTTTAKRTAPARDSRGRFLPRSAVQVQVSAPNQVPESALAEIPAWLGLAMVNQRMDGVDPLVREVQAPVMRRGARRIPARWIGAAAAWAVVAIPGALYAWHLLG